MTLSGGRVGRIASQIAVALLFVLLLRVVAFQPWFPSFRYILFTDRELTRAAHWWQDLPVTGAELTGEAGVRTPGPLLLALFALPRVVTADPHAVYALQCGLYALGLLVLFREVTRHWNAWTGLLAVWWFASTQVVFECQRTLWNPGFLPLFLCVAVAATLRVAIERDGRAVAVALVAVALGAQLHLSILALGVPLLVLTLVTWPPKAAAGLAAGLAGALLVYAPYLIQLVRASGASQDLLQQAQATAGHDGAQVVAHVREALVALVRFDPVEGGDAPGLTGVVRRIPGLLALVAMGGAAIGAWTSRTVEGRSRGVVWLTAIVVSGALIVGAGSSTPVAPRYLIVLFAPLAVLAASAASGVVLSLSRLHRGLGVVAIAALAWISNARAPDWAALDVRGHEPMTAQLARRITLWAGEEEAPGGGDYDSLRLLLDHLHARLGWSVADVAARTYWRGGGRGRQEDWGLTVPVEHLLTEQGQSFPGSRPPPCALMVVNLPPQDRGMTPRQMVDEFVPHAVPLVGEPTSEVLNAGTLVMYTLESGLCPTTMTQRYIESPDEQALRALYPTLAPGEVRELPVPAGRRFVYRLPMTSAALRAAIAVDVVVKDGQAQIGVTSPQLRGRCDNPGWYGTLNAARLRLIATPVDGAGAPIDLPIYDDVVGPGSALGPLSVARPAPPPATYRLDLAFDTMAWSPGDPLPPRHGVATPVRTTLTQAWTVP